MAAGDALQFGELVDHARLQVVLRQFRGTACLRGIGADLCGNGFCQRCHARDLACDAAQLGLVGDGLQAIAHRHQALLEVLVEEELGVGETRTDHALVALAHFIDVLRLDVGDADEMLGQPAAIAQHREELLVDLHRLDQRFLRHGQEGGLETAQHRRRPLGQADHLLQVVVGDARAAAGLGCRLLDFGDDARAAGVGIDQHLRALQGHHVIARVVDPHRLVVFEAMAAAHAVGRHAQYLGRHHVLAQQQHQPVHGARERVLVRAPAHRLGNRHAGQRLAHDVGQQVGGLRARLHRTVDEALALAVGGAFQRLPVDPRFRSEAFQRLGRRTVRVQRDVEIRAQYFGLLLGLFHIHGRQQHRQTARRVQRLGIATLEADAALLQCGDHAIEEGLRQAGQRLDRQLFGAEFDQQGFLFAHVVKPCGAFPFSPREKVPEGRMRGDGVMTVKPSGLHRPSPQPLSPTGTSCGRRGERDSMRFLSSIPGSPASPAARNTPRPPPAPACARAGCSAGVRSRRSRGAHPAG